MPDLLVHNTTKPQAIKLYYIMAEHKYSKVF